MDGTPEGEVGRGRSPLCGAGATLHSLKPLCPCLPVQMEQAFARHLLETPEEQAAILSLLHGNPDSTRLP